MFRRFLFVLPALLTPLLLLAQARPATKTAAKAKSAHSAPKTAKAAPKATKTLPAKATTAATDAKPADGAPPALAPIARAPVTPAPSPNALKIKAELNPIAQTLTVRCDAPGPTRYEINDQQGRPVLTKNQMTGTYPVVLNVASLPPGPYVVRCIAGEKKGMKLVQL